MLRFGIYSECGVSRSADRLEVDGRGREQGKKTAKAVVRVISWVGGTVSYQTGQTVTEADSGAGELNFGMSEISVRHPREAVEYAAGSESLTRGSRLWNVSSDWNHYEKE